MMLEQRLRLHRQKPHPIFQYGDVEIEVLERDVPDDKLLRAEGVHIKRYGLDNLFNVRVAGRTPKERYWDNIDTRRERNRNEYTTKRDGGDGSYRQLLNYNKNKFDILRKICLNRAHKLKRLPTVRSRKKFNMTAEEIADIQKSIDNNLQKGMDARPRHG